LVVIEQFAHAAGFVQWVELLLDNLFELFEELDDVVVLVLARVISFQFDLFCSTVLILFSRCALHTVLLMLVLEL